MARYPLGTTPKLTEQIIEDIRIAIARGAYVETAAALAGISKQTFYRWLKDAEGEASSELTEKLSDAVKKAMAESEMRDLAVIDAAAQGGEWTAAAWRLERKFPNKWGRQAKVQLEHSVVELDSSPSEEAREKIKRLLSDPSAVAAIELIEGKLNDEGS